MFHEEIQLNWARIADELALRVLVVRLTQHVTQAALAEAAGLTRSQVQNIEYGQGHDVQQTSNPTLRTVYQIARALGVPPGILLPGCGTTPGRRRMPPLSAVEGQVSEYVRSVVDRYPVPISTRVSPRLYAQDQFTARGACGPRDQSTAPGG